ncbi:TPA: hypothetical protein EYP66_23805 [Candidatus Poribacteria bacterium]|nr:hypothetical protein [Candidatus Poribacteria bacterium]
MPAPKTIYFSQIAAGGWNDWVRIVNISNQQAKVLAIARNHAASTVWSAEHNLNPFEAWHPPVQGQADRRGDVSLEVRSDQPIVGERHCHSGTQVLDFPGAAPENRTVANRLFFPELYSGAYDWLRVFNVGEQDALISVVARDVNGRIIRQLQGRVRPLGWWDFSDRNIGQIDGTLEVMSSQPVVAERHMHYSGNRTAVGQLGVAID